MLMRRFGFMGMLSGIVLIGASMGFGVGREPIFGRSRGIVRSTVAVVPDIEAASLPEP